MSTPQALSDDALKGAVLYELVFHPGSRRLARFQREAKRRFDKRRGKGAAK